MKKVIYTCVVGNYDVLNDPKYVDQEWDYICFSNDLKDKNYSVWRIKPIPVNHRNSVVQSRYVKFFPHLVLDEYEVSLWIDANIEINESFYETKLVELISNPQIHLSIPTHPLRNCIYKEAMNCILEGKDKKKVIFRHIRFLQSKNFPINQGLFENNLIFRRHNCFELKTMSQEWWRVFLDYSKRDQLSLVFILWLQNIECTKMFVEPFDIRKSRHFIYSVHNYSIKYKLVKKIRGFTNKF